MELVGILHVLLAHRRLIALGAVLAALVAVVVDSRVESRSSSGVAIQRVLIGPPDAPAVNTDVQAPTDALITRTKLLADLLSSDAVRTTIARGARIPPEQLVVKGPATLPPWVPAPLAVRASQVAAVARTPYVLTVEAADANPIMTLTAGAPGPRAAADLVSSATATVEDLLARNAHDPQALAVQPLGRAVAGAVVKRPSHLVTAAVPMVFLVLWCGGIVLVAGFAAQARRRRAQAVASSRGMAALLP